jgi:hypothetical protein
MRLIFHFIQNNFFIFLALALIWTIAWMAYFLWRRSRTGPQFPSLDQVTVLFRERFASGASHLTWITRLGGAQNCLSVTLTDSELWITTFFPFTAFAGFYDLEHRIPTIQLRSVQQNGKAVTIDFDARDGDTWRVVLYLRRASEFMAVIPPHVVT